jgi:hypothetical protein
VDYLGALQTSKESAGRLAEVDCRLGELTAQELRIDQPEKDLAAAVFRHSSEQLDSRSTLVRARLLRQEKAEVDSF